MSIYAISDLHLSFGSDKPMDIFGNNWENQIESEMVKTDLGFQIEVELQDKETFNFCIKNEKDEWDNNDGNNYIKYKIQLKNFGKIQSKAARDG